MEALVVAAAVGWWESRRPARWTKEQHVRSPTVNCATESERVLAKHVAKLVASGL